MTKGDEHKDWFEQLGGVDTGNLCLECGQAVESLMDPHAGKSRENAMLQTVEDILQEKNGMKELSPHKLSLFQQA